MKSLIKRIKHKILFSNEYIDFITHLKIIPITPTDLMNDNLKKELFQIYRDIFGHGGEGDWGEYAKCVSCEKVYDIEQIHGLEDYVHISELPTLPDSPCCHVKLVFFHDEKSLHEKFDLLIKKQDLIVYILKDKKTNRIVGLIIGFIDSMNVVWNENIKEKLILPSNFSLNTSFSNRKVVYIDEIGIVKNYRRGTIPILLLLNAFLREAGKHKNIEDILFWTSKGSKLFTLIKQLPYKIVLEDLEIVPRVVITLPLKKSLSKVRFLEMVYN